MKKFFNFYFFIYFNKITNLNAKENIVFIDLNYVLNESRMEKNFG